MEGGGLGVGCRVVATCLGESSRTRLMASGGPARDTLLALMSDTPVPCCPDTPSGGTGIHERQGVQILPVNLPTPPQTFAEAAILEPALGQFYSGAVC